MKTRIKHIDDCLRLFEVEIPPEVVNKTLEEVYLEIKRAAKIPGFRMGTAPQDLLEKYHAKDAEEEVLKRLIPEGYRQALKDHNINPVTFPEIADIEFDKKGRISFKAKLEIRPEIKLRNYKGIKVKRRRAEVNQDEVQKALKRLQEIHAQFIPVQNRRSIQKGDYTICDIEAFVDEKPIPNAETSREKHRDPEEILEKKTSFGISKKHQNMWIEAKGEASLLGLGESLLGMNIGEGKDINTKLPENYPDKKFAGRNAIFKVVVKEIKEKKVPNLDDEFARDLGKENLKTLQEDLFNQLHEKNQTQEKINMENQIIDRLLSEHRFSVPQSLVKRQFDGLLKQAEQELLSRGLHKDVVEEKKKELEPRLKEDALNKVRIYFILDEISKKEDIQVTEADVTKRLENVSRVTNQDINAVKEYYEKNNLIDGLEEQLKEEKTLDWLLNVSQVMEENSKVKSQNSKPNLKAQNF